MEEKGLEVNMEKTRLGGVGLIQARCRNPRSIYAEQGWVFAVAKSIFAGTVEKTGKNLYFVGLLELRIHNF